MEKRICEKCKTEYDIEKFQIRNKKTGTRQHWCSNCLNEQKKSHYQENKKKYLERNKNRLNELRTFINSFKKECVKCGYNKCKQALDFHHKDPSQKEIEIAIIARKGWSKERIEKEINKCIVLCKNCHAEIHAPVA